jgi:hypothetical protein
MDERDQGEAVAVGVAAARILADIQARAEGDHLKPRASVGIVTEINYGGQSGHAAGLRMKQAI